MIDKELLELSAKAAGIETYWWPLDEPIFLRLKENNERWHPLKDDDSALRLAVKLQIMVEPYDDTVYCYYSMSEGHFSEPTTDDPYAATRRAIVRAAAEIGKAM